MADVELDPLPPAPEAGGKPAPRPTDDVSPNPVEPVVSLSQAVVEGEPKAEGERPRAETKPLKDEDLIAVIAQVSSIGLPPDLAEQYAKEISNDPLLNWGFGMIGMADALEKMGFNGSGQSLPPWMRVAGGLVVAGWVVMQTRGRYGQPLTDPANPGPGNSTPDATGVRAPDFGGAYATANPEASGD